MLVKVEVLMLFKGISKSKLFSFILFCADVVLLLCLEVWGGGPCSFDDTCFYGRIGASAAICRNCLLFSVAALACISVIFRRHHDFVYG